MLNNKELSFIIKKPNKKIEDFQEVFKISKSTFKYFRMKELEVFFVAGYETMPNKYIWFWETMPEVFIMKQKYKKSLHNMFKEYIYREFEPNKHIYLYICHFNHPHFIATKLIIPDKEYLKKHIVFIRTMKFEFNMGCMSNCTIPVGKSLDFVKIGIVDSFKRIKMYYDIYKHNTNIFFY